MSLACGDEASQVLVEVLHLSIGQVTDMRIGPRQWSIICIAAIRKNGWVGAGYDSVHVFDESFLCCFRAGIRGGQGMLHIRGIKKPGQAMDVRAASVLPLKAEPEVSGTKNANVESVYKLLNTMMKEPVSNGWVLLQGLSMV